LAARGHDEFISLMALGVVSVGRTELLLPSWELGVANRVPLRAGGTDRLRRRWEMKEKEKREKIEGR
jgi:hypothetical protein